MNPLGNSKLGSNATSEVFFGYSSWLFGGLSLNSCILYSRTHGTPSALGSPSSPKQGQHPTLLCLASSRVGIFWGFHFLEGQVSTEAFPYFFQLTASLSFCVNRTNMDESCSEHVQSYYLLISVKRVHGNLKGRCLFLLALDSFKFLGRVSTFHGSVCIQVSKIRQKYKSIKNLCQISHFAASVYHWGYQTILFWWRRMGISPMGRIVKTGHTHWYDSVVFSVKGARNQRMASHKAWVLRAASNLVVEQASRTSVKKVGCTIWKPNDLCEIMWKTLGNKLDMWDASLVLGGKLCAS